MSQPTPGRKRHEGNILRRLCYKNLVKFFKLHLKLQIKPALTITNSLTHCTRGEKRQKLRKTGRPG